MRAQVSLDPDLYELARDEAKQLGISFAELCRRALSQALRHRGRGSPWMRFAGKVELDDPDASTSVDEVVYGRERPYLGFEGAKVVPGLAELRIDQGEPIRA